MAILILLLFYAVYLSPLFLIARGYCYHRHSGKWTVASLVAATAMGYLLVRLLGESSGEFGIMLYFPLWAVGLFVSLLFWFTAFMMHEK